MSAANQHNDHVYAFWNAPYSAKPEWTRAYIQELEDNLNNNCNRSADDYYAVKALIRKLSAGLANMKPGQYDPMGHWFGMQSN